VKKGKHLPEMGHEHWLMLQELQEEDRVTIEAGIKNSTIVNKQIAKGQLWASILSIKSLRTIVTRGIYTLMCAHVHTHRGSSAWIYGTKLAEISHHSRRDMKPGPILFYLWSKSLTSVKNSKLYFPPEY
jgi:hypothetical protein